MTKQEEIREYFKNELGNVWADGRDGRGIDLNYLADNIFEFLHSAGCVLKVGGELPQNPYAGETGYEYEDMGYSTAEYNILEAGYVAVEPLIEDTAKLAREKK